jgi:hypothetical protein
MDAFKGPTTLAPSQGKVTSINMNLELASVLFNAGVLIMVYASNAYLDGAGGAEGLKTAAKYFKKAAGVFVAASTAATKVDQAVSVDLSPECLSMLEQLCLAHAQRCFYEKVVPPSPSPCIPSPNYLWQPQLIHAPARVSGFGFGISDFWSRLPVYARWSVSPRVLPKP